MPAPDLLIVTALDLNWTLQTTVMPGGVRATKSNDWELTRILNRGSPVVNYGSSDSMKVTFTVECYVTRPGGEENEVLRPVRDFLSLTYPVTPGTTPPSRCAITYGDARLYSGWLCVCESVSVHHGAHRMWNARGESMTALVDVTFLEVDPLNKPASWLSPGSVKIYPWGGV